MKFFSKRLVAILMTVIIIISSTLLSVNIKLTKDIASVTEGFYKGVIIKGRRDVSIHSQLLVIAREAEVLVDIAEDNGIDTDDVADDIYEFSREVTTMDEGVADIYEDYQELLDDISKLGAALRSISLGASQEEAVISCLSAIIDAQDLIETSAYNESVRKYHSSMTIPAEFFADLAGVRPPEYFA